MTLVIPERGVTRADDVGDIGEHAFRCRPATGTASLAGPDPTIFAVNLERVAFTAKGQEQRIVQLAIEYYRGVETSL
jgi:hypothetical protein